MAVAARGFDTALLQCSLHPKTLLSRSAIDSMSFIWSCFSGSQPFSEAGFKIQECFALHRAEESRILCEWWHLLSFYVIRMLCFCRLGTPWNDPSPWNKAVVHIPVVQLTSRSFFLVSCVELPWHDFLTTSLWYTSSSYDHSSSYQKIFAIYPGYQLCPSDTKWNIEERKQTLVLLRHTKACWYTCFATDLGPRRTWTFICPLIMVAREDLQVNIWSPDQIMFWKLGYINTNKHKCGHPAYEMQPQVNMPAVRCTSLDHGEELRDAWDVKPLVYLGYPFRVLIFCLFCLQSEGKR